MKIPEAISFAIPGQITGIIPSKIPEGVSWDTSQQAISRGNRRETSGELPGKNP